MKEKISRWSSCDIPTMLGAGIGIIVGTLAFVTYAIDPGGKVKPDQWFDRVVMLVVTALCIGFCIWVECTLWPRNTRKSKENRKV